MQTKANADLSQFHTFAITQTCQYLVEVESVEEIIEVYRSPKWAELPKLMLGKGSNMLFTEAYQGVVVINKLLGKTVTETDDYWHLHIAGGEDWPELVKWTIKHGYNGLENLALIPGCAGSAPIQNIGAYGVELKDVCEYVDLLCLETFTSKRLNAEDCQFSYRDSIFKHELYGNVIITAIGLKLTKSWQSNIEYGPLKELATPEITAEAIFDRVCQIRMEKLPDPRVTGNAGSFFKNPIIPHALYESLKQKYPNLVAYPATDGMKVAAGWLIDQCSLKGVTIGGAQVHPNQALVLVNSNEATAKDVLMLAQKVCQAVFERYQISLEHEVRFMDATGETSLQQLIQQGKV